MKPIFKSLYNKYILKNLDADYMILYIAYLHVHPYADSLLIWQHLHTAYSLWAIYSLSCQFSIVSFQPPVRLIDIIARAADTRLHFYNPTQRKLKKKDFFQFLFNIFITMCFSYFFIFTSRGRAHWIKFLLAAKSFTNV